MLWGKVLVLLSAFLSPSEPSLISSDVILGASEPPKPLFPPKGCLSSLLPRGSCPHHDSLMTPISMALCGLASVFLLVSLLFP